MNINGKQQSKKRMNYAPEMSEKKKKKKQTAQNFSLFALFILLF